MNNRKILVVDDEEPILLFMEKALGKLGYQTKLANGGDEAVGILGEENYPLIITDLKMPGMSGIQLCKKIRQTNDSSIIYALSGFISEYKPEKLEEFGFDGYLTKPSKLDVLKRAVEGAFDKLEQRTGT